MIKQVLAALTLLFATFASPTRARTFSASAPRLTPQKEAPVFIAQEVRHRLVMLPYYNLFDWLEGEVSPDDVVTLRGQVVKPTTKSDAEATVRKIDGVKDVVNEIEVLPLSNSDDRIRRAVYRALFNYGSPLFRYATQAVPPIHIIVKNGRVTLKGVVATAQDSQIAYIKANGVPGVFQVKNELQVEKAGPH